MALDGVDGVDGARWRGREKATGPFTNFKYNDRQNYVNTFANINEFMKFQPIAQFHLCRTVNPSPHGVNVEAEVPGLNKTWRRKVRTDFALNNVHNEPFFSEFFFQTTFCKTSPSFPGWQSMLGLNPRQIRVNTPSVQH